MIGNIKITRGLYISRTRRHDPDGAIVSSFGMRGVMADVITHAKFFINRFRGFVLEL